MERLVVYSSLNFKLICMLMNHTQESYVGNCRYKVKHVKVIST